MESRDVTLRDYFRVFAAGKWALIIGAVAVALVALIVNLTRPVTYHAESIVYMGVSFNAAGVVVSSPFTTPVTATRTLKADQIIGDAARRAGMTVQQVKDMADTNVDRVPGAAGGNQPTVAILSFDGKNRKQAVRGANAYADAALDVVKQPFDEVYDQYKLTSTQADARIKAVQANISRLSGKAGSETSLVVLQSELSDNMKVATDARTALATIAQFQPNIVSRAETASPSATMTSRAIIVLFGAIVGLVLGAIVALIWKGSPAERK